MTHYAIAHLTDVNFNEEIRAYLEQIDATLAPFGGRFLIHGDRPDIREGQFAGDIVIIALPDAASVQGWYESEAYARLLPLRQNNAQGWVIMVAGVDADHKATDIL